MGERQVAGRKGFARAEGAGLPLHGAPGPEGSAYSGLGPFRRTSVHTEPSHFPQAPWVARQVR